MSAALIPDGSSFVSIIPTTKTKATPAKKVAAKKVAAKKAKVAKK